MRAARAEKEVVRAAVESYSGVKVNAVYRRAQNWTQSCVIVVASRSDLKGERRDIGRIYVDVVGLEINEKIVPRRPIHLFRIVERD